MTTRRAIPMPTPPEWNPERSLRAVQAQLNELSTLEGLNYQEGKPKEESWKQITHAALDRAFSSDSQILMNFLRASSAGQYNMGGMSPGRMQNNYSARIAAYKIALNTAIADLKMSLPEDFSEVYEAEDPFAFFKDLRSMLRQASSHIFIVDAYIDSSLFELYLHDISVPSLRILSNNVRSQVAGIAGIFARSKSGFELRTTAALHDRVIFIDDRCWVVGQSLKDAAAKKPTYLVEISAAGMQGTYEALWNSAAVVVKS